MLQMFPEATSFGTEFARSLGSGLGRGMSKQADFARQMALEEGKAKFKQKEDANINKVKTLEGLRSSIEEMKGLADSAGTGLLGQLNLSGAARYNRGRMQTLKGELLNYYKTLFPRGLTQQEFKKLEQDYLPGDYDTVDKMKGKLDAFDDLIERKLQQYEGEGSGEKEKKEGKVKFDPQNKEHQAKAKQLYKTYGDKEKVREALKREFEGL